MKRITCAMLAVALLVGMCAAMPAQAANPAVAVVYNPNPADRLNLREGPSAKAAVIAKYYTGVTMLVYSGPSEWIEVQIGATRGYVQEEYTSQCGILSSIDYGVLSSIGRAMPTGYLYAANGGNINLREAPNANSTVAVKYPSGTPLLIGGVSSDGKWYHITTKGDSWMEGYVQAQFVSTDAPVRPVGPTAKPQPGANAVVVVNNPNPVDRLNLRDAPNDKATIITKYYTGALLMVHGWVGNDWLEVQNGTTHGYVQAKYVLFCGDMSGLDMSTINRAGSAMPTGYIYAANGGNVNLREMPNANSAVLSKYPSGTQLIIGGVSGDGKWYHVTAQGSSWMEGYIQAQYVSTDAPIRPVGSTAKPQPVNTGKWAVVNCSSLAETLTLRERASTAAASRGEYYNGATVEVLSTTGDWCSVRVGNKTGYMARRLLRMDSETPEQITFAGAHTDTYLSGATKFELKQWPSRSASNVKTYNNNGATMDVLGRAGCWYYIRMRDDGKTGYMLSQNLRVYAAPTGSKRYGIVSNPNEQERLNLRDKPGESGRVLDKFFNGTQVEILDFDQVYVENWRVANGWYKVRVNGLTGYMQMQYVQPVMVGNGTPG